MALTDKFPKGDKKIVMDYSATTIDEATTIEALIIEIEAAFH